MSTLAPPRPPAPSTAPPPPPSPAAAREGAVLRAGLLVMAVAVADHAFLRPEPGTTGADHLASGLVPLALALGLAVLAPRLGPRLVAVTSLICGALAIVAAAVTLDVTGSAAGLAGAVLIVAGVAGLWRQRDRTGRLPRRIARRAGWTLAGLLVAYFVVMPIGLAIIVTHKPRVVAAAADLGRASSPVTLRTSDGLRLAGTYVPSRNGAAVLVFPGRAQTLPHARLLVRHGYGVLVVDPRGQGRSDGDPNRRGWGGQPDIAAAVDYLASRPGVRAIGAVGLSVGGEMLLEAAAGDPRLAAVVSEGAGVRSLAEQMHFPDVPKPLRWLSSHLGETAAGIVLADHLAPPDLVDLMPGIAPRRVLLIRGRDGNPDEVLNTVYRDAARGAATLWEAPGGHTGALSADPRQYERRVVGFLDHALLAAPSTTEGGAR